jgi:hypothetical protein
MNPINLSYFPKDYEQSRTRFLQETSQHEGKPKLHQWKVPCARDQNLFVDSAYLPALNNKKRLFILISGTHGLEGYAGSGIQQLFLQEFLNKIDRSDSGFLIIHSLNPFGFKYHRRGTEAGVNLNRNCSIEASFFQIQNRKSMEFAKQFIPTQPVASEISQLLKVMKKNGDGVLFDDVSMDEFIKVVGLGQFHDARGLEYGGAAPEPQIEALIHLLKELIPQYKDVVHLDLHTGLGERGRLHLLIDGQPEALHPDLFAEILDPGLDKEVYDFTDINDPGFYKTRGATNNLIAELITPAQRACALTLEFGTLGHSLEAQFKALNSWMLEHQGLFYGYANKELENKVRDLYLERFFPSDSKWKEAILRVSYEFFKRVFSRSGILN